MNRNNDQNNDFEYISSLFDNDGVKTPESLSEDSIMSMLPDRNEEAREVPMTSSPASTAADPERSAEFTVVKESKWFEPKRWISLAAVLMIAMFGVMQLYGSLTAPPDTAMKNGELYTFKNQSEIKHLVDSFDNHDVYNDYYTLDGGTGMEVMEDAEMAAEDNSSAGLLAPSTGNSMVKSEARTSGSSNSGADHSDTYLQVDEVDEADIVKTDGRYIYYVTGSREVVILSAKDGKTKQLSRIGSSDIENYIHDIYLKGDILVTVGRFYTGGDGYTGIVTYDISDREDPKMITNFAQTGEIISSRMVGNYVYLVTSDQVWKGGRLVPKCTVDGAYKEMTPGSISCVPEPKQASYIVLGAMDITSGKEAKSKTTAIFGATDDIYCNDHNLYAAVYEWDNNSEEPYTRIVRASLDGLKVKFNGTAKVRGYIDNQFSMDEKDGYFRIATTGSRDGIDVNNLFVLDKDLKEAGTLTGFARNESIKSVRYFGDKAYVITYEQIDPLFIIDLSDPTRPKIDGEVKIDGFSTLLVPAGDGRLLGIGHATGDNGYGGEYASGLKLVVFDISDPSEPKVIRSREFKDMESPAQDTHKALTVNAKEGWYAIPYEIYNYDEEVIIDEDVVADDAETSTETPDESSAVIDDGDAYPEPDYETGVLVFGADDELTVYDQHKLEGERILRSVYIGDYIYALNDDGSASSFQFRK